jgi:hypothetical protein
VLLLIPILLYLNHEFLRRSSLDIIGKDTPNPFEPLIFPSYRQNDGKYIRGYKVCIQHNQDQSLTLAGLRVHCLLHHFLFLVRRPFACYHPLTQNSTRQATTMWFLRPLAKKLGVKGSKIERFCERQ